MWDAIQIILPTALLSSAITLVVAWLWWQRAWRREMDRRMQELHDNIGRTIEARTRRAVADALADINAGDVLREATWKAARSSSEFLSGGLNAILGKRRRTDYEPRSDADEGNT